jgi:hypothetical protein
LRLHITDSPAWLSHCRRPPNCGQFRATVAARSWYRPEVLPASGRCRRARVGPMGDREVPSRRRSPTGRLRRLRRLGLME